ncbi:MAG TPA: hypothetical protein VK793_04095 [Steroidobacteraceae bacterium]|jgi:hypothetical protein|nr:hypothetical protein [Steroidobacteraceae bacterium]
MNTTDPQDPAEQRLDRTLRDLPLRRAPPTLEARVCGELTRRAARPWWRRSFAQWPLPARAAFLVLCAVLIRLAFMGGSAAVAEVHSLPWARQAGVLVASLSNLTAAIAHISPPAWLYEGLAVCGVLYAVLFGLGAVMYRMLYLQSTAGDPIA